MTESDRIQNEYFEWMYELVFGDNHSESISYRKLLMHLHNITVKHIIATEIIIQALLYKSIIQAAILIVFLLLLLIRV